jgi:cob(I)alamin adenosyltransferase
MTMKIYTKKGDKGKTSLIGSTRVPKHHLRIETYGTVDELNAHIGLIRDQSLDESTRDLLKEIQDRLFTIGSSLASDPEKSKMKIPDLKESDVSKLEEAIDTINDELPELKSFILPGGHTVASYYHIARCICRRAERYAVHLSEEEFVAKLIIKYLNRISDYIFVLARKITHDKGGEEVPWTPRM